LKSEHFENLLQRLDPDREQAGKTYEDLRRRLIKFFEWNFCFPAEDLVDETLDRVAERLDEVQVLDVAGFAWGVAKHVRQEASKRSERTVQISDLPSGAELPARETTPEKFVQEEMDEGQRARCLRLCLHRYPPRDRELFLKYHNVEGDHKEHRERLAQELGISIGTLRVRINRLREKLEQCLHNCMASQGRDKRR
jgi:RNA polymerase sigma factor (sigma-70 family)